MLLVGSIFVIIFVKKVQCPIAQPQYQWESQSIGAGSDVLSNFPNPTKIINPSTSHENQQTQSEPTLEELLESCVAQAQKENKAQSQERLLQPSTEEVRYDPSCAELIKLRMEQIQGDTILPIGDDLTVHHQDDISDDRGMESSDDDILRPEVIDLDAKNQKKTRSRKRATIKRTEIIPKEPRKKKTRSKSQKIDNSQMSESNPNPPQVQDNDKSDRNSLGQEHQTNVGSSDLYAPVINSEEFLRSLFGRSDDLLSADNPPTNSGESLLGIIDKSGNYPKQAEDIIEPPEEMQVDHTYSKLSKVNPINGNSRKRMRKVTNDPSVLSLDSILSHVHNDHTYSTVSRRKTSPKKVKRPYKPDQDNLGQEQKEMTDTADSRINVEQSDEILNEIQTQPDFKSLVETPLQPDDTIWKQIIEGFGNGGLAEPAVGTQQESSDNQDMTAMSEVEVTSTDLSDFGGSGSGTTSSSSERDTKKNDRKELLSVLREHFQHRIKRKEAEKAENTDTNCKADFMIRVPGTNKCVYAFKRAPIPQQIEIEHVLE